MELVPDNHCGLSLYTRDRNSRPSQYFKFYLIHRQTHYQGVVTGYERNQILVKLGVEKQTVSFGHCVLGMRMFFEFGHVEFEKSRNQY